MTLDDAIELRAGDQLVGLDEEPRVVLDVIYSDFNSPSIGSQWRLPVLNLDTGETRRFNANGFLNSKSWRRAA